MHSLPENHLSNALLIIYLFFETVRIRHHMYSYPSDEGLYSQFLCVCDQLLDRHPRQEGACQLMV